MGDDKNNVIDRNHIIISALIVISFFLMVILSVQARGYQSFQENNELRASEVNVTIEEPEASFDIDPIFIQGLEIINNRIVVGTGLYGKSSIGYLEGSNYEAVQFLPDDEFGEGITSDGDYVYQLTWTNEELIKRDIKTLNEIERIPYEGEGWGLAFDGDNLIRSDGTNTIYFHNPKTFSIEREIHTDYNNLNELEYHNGYLYANVWKENFILKIDPDSGEIIKKIDLSNIADKHTGENVEHTLNGIAYLEDDVFIITGKNWGTAYLIRLS